MKTNWNVARVGRLNIARLLAALVLGALVNGGLGSSLAQDFLTNGLVAYYPLNGNAEDASGHGHHGTIFGTTPTPDRQNKENSALQFDGVDDLIRVPHSEDFNVLSALSISLWVRFLSDPAGQAWSFVSKSSSENNTGYIFPYVHSESGRVFLLVHTAATAWDLDGGFAYTNIMRPFDWHQYVGTYDGQTRVVYLDGQQVDMTRLNGPITANANDLIIGNQPDFPEWVNAEMDDVRIYSRALAESEVRSLYDYESNLNLTNSPPVILMQPVGKNLYVGDTTRLDSMAAGTWPLAYQWSKDGENLPNATNATLVLPNVTLADTGDYSVVVSNAFGSVTSAVARVTVTERPWPYFADFEGLIGQEWSKRQTDVTPVGSRRFLGQFGNDTVSLTLNALPPHQAVTVALDLFVIRTWDGLQPGSTEVWDLGISGGPTLLHTTFLNFPFDWPVSQSFPDEYPGGNHPSRTGAAENNTLGFIWPDSGVMDAVYHLVFTFPHAADAVTLNFSGRDLEDLGNESWGLDNVRIELTPAAGVAYVRTELSPRGSVALPGTAVTDRVATSGTRALVMAGEAAVALVDLKEPAKPVVLGRWEPLFPPAAFALAGNVAYIASYEADLLSTVEIVDFTDPAKPVLKGYYDTAGYARDVAVVGSTLYVADDAAGLAIVDVSDPARPRRIGGYDTQGRMSQVQVANRRAYLADGDWLLILDVSDPAFPVRVGLYDLAGAVQALRVSGPTAYVLVGTGELRLLDVSDPADVRLLGTYRTWGMQSLAVAGKYAYLAKASRGLEVVDVSDPAKPVWVTGVSTAGRAEDVAVTGTSVVVAGGDQGVVVYRLEQGIYPPLAPPVIAEGMLTLSWPVMEGVRLQVTTDLVTSPWVDVAGSDTTNTVRLPMTEARAFFRLIAK